MSTLPRRLLGMSVCMWPTAQLHCLVVNDCSCFAICAPPWIGSGGGCYGAPLRSEQANEHAAAMVPISLTELL